jgi:transposase
MMLRLGKIYPGIKTRNARHRAWLVNLKLEHRVQRFALEEMLQGERQAGERLERLEQAIREAVADWSLAPVVPALMAMRGLDLVAAVTVQAEVGDFSRFENSRQLMAYLGLVPSERSTGESVKRGGITKAGNGRAQRVLVEAAWSYRHPPRVGVEKQVLVSAAPRAAREIAWKAQVRLTKRFRTLSRKDKRATVVATAIARELAAFIWAITRSVPTPTAPRAA